MSLRAISRMYNVSYFCVQYRCRQFGIKTRPKTSKRIHIDKAILQRLCIKEGKSSQEVAEVLSCSSVTIRERCKEYGVPLKGQQLGRITKEHLQKLYTTEGKSTREVAKVLGCSPETVRMRCKQFGIPMRKPSRDGLKLDKALLARLYLKENKSMTDIATICGCSIATISNRLKGFGLTKAGKKSA
jgi:DNA-binding CsgD family transcriptional regulator